MLPLLVLTSTALQQPVLDALRRIERGIFAADRSRDDLLRRVADKVAGGDALSRLAPESYALQPGSAVAITGASDGIGRETAAFLARAGYPVVLCARDPDKGEAARTYVATATNAKVAVVPLDLSSVSSVRAAIPAIVDAASVLGAPLRGLVLNAGVWPTKKATTSDGMELGFQTCHVGHWQLTEGLLPTLCADLSEGEEARIVTVSSSAHALSDGLSLEDAAWETRPWDSSAAYGASKLANLLHAQELAQRAAPSAGRLTSLAVHPGVVATSLFREFGPLSTPLPSLDGPALQASPLSLVLKTSEEGSRTSLYALLAPGLPSGSYLSDCALTDVSPAAKDPKARRELWEWTARWLAEREPAESVAEPQDDDE